MTEELDTVMNYILIINSVLVVFESLQDLSNMDTTSTDGMWAAVEFGFSILYVVELFLRRVARHEQLFQIKGYHQLFLRAKLRRLLWRA